MNKLIAVILSICMIFSMVGAASGEENKITTTEDISATVTDTLQDEFGDEYTVDVNTMYVSSTFLEELEFNSRETNYFGYYLSDIEEQLDGQKYVFTLGEDGETTVKLFEPYDDTYDIALKNAAIGTGIIVVCITVSAVTGGLGAPAVSAVFAVAAKNAAIYGVSSGAISGVVAGVCEAAKGGTTDSALKAAASVGSSSFMWGAVSGAAIGGIGEAAALHSATASGLTMNEVAAIRKQTGWSTEIIKQIRTPEEAKIYADAGLHEQIINGRSVLVQNGIDMDYMTTMPDGTKWTNLERMQNGYAPIERATGKPYELHHINQSTDGTLAMMTDSEHILIPNTPGKTGVHSVISDGKWNRQRKDIWKGFAESVVGGEK